jgi:hypothetical protein
MLVRGSEEDLDLEGLQSITVYEGFDPGEQIVKDFWALINLKFTQDLKKKFLLFATGSDRVFCLFLYDLGSCDRHPEYEVQTELFGA